MGQPLCLCLIIFQIALDYSPVLSLRDLLISPLIFLFLILFSTLARVGLEGLRFLGGTRLSRTRSTNRSLTSTLLRYWDLYFSDTSTRTPLSLMRLPKRLKTIFFCSSFKHADSPGDQRSSTRDSVLFTCCPPGPEERLVRNSTSRIKHSRMD